MADGSGGNLDYRDPEGKRFVGFLARPVRPNGAAVLIAHAAPGVGDHERDVARRLADLGYTALVADYHGEGAVFFGEEMGARLAPLLADPALVRDPMRAGLAALVAQPGVDAGRIAAIGFCFGGAAVLELACDGAQVKAVVGFHSSLPLNRPEDYRRITGKVLILNGAADPLVPPEVRSSFEGQMNAAGVDWRMYLYGGAEHAFTMVGSEKFGMAGVSYNKPADDRSWRAMLDLFQETIAEPTPQP